MSTPNQPASVPAPQVPQNSARNWLIGGLLAVTAAIVFGLLYLFVIAPSVPNGSVGWYLFSFATGLTMIVMPCTLPLAFVIVPLSMGKGMVKGISMALAFGIGVAFTLSLYGVAAAILGKFALGALTTDLETMKNWIYFGAGSLALVFALSEIGLMKFHMPTYTGAAPAFIQKRQEVLKAFFLGAFLGNVGVGCPHPATPLLLIEVATKGDMLYGWTIFLIHAIGRVLPLLLLAFLAILGVNGLNWLMARKDAVERATGWAMVFVAGFILTLGLFSHKWWVNSGIHSGLEVITRESAVNSIINNTLGTNVPHLHGSETGTGLFGLPLAWGSWFLVFLWLFPIWWWYARRKKQMLNSPAFRIVALEAQIDRLEKDRRQIESMMNVDELETTFDLKHAQEEIDALEAKRREEEGKISYGETGAYKEPIARAYEEKILRIQRNYLILVSIGLALIFIHFIPTNFYLKQFDPNAPSHPMGAVSTTTGPVYTPFTKSTNGLKEATEPVFVELNNGDSYDITAGYVKKEVGNKELRMLAYNGSIPGPFIKAKQGSTVTINFTNDTDVDQTIHSHGLRLNNLFDGVPDVTQTTVKPGEKFTYTLDFPDAGIAWYHPHTRDDYGQELGLYGNYLISSNDENYWSKVNREIPLIVDDILIENNQIADFYKEVVDHALLGRFGNTYLVNGETDSITNVKSGEVVRLLLTNVSNARTYKFSIPGAQIKVVGAEWGRLEQEEYKDTFLLSPAERAVVEVYFPKAGLYKLTNNLPDKQVVVSSFVAGEEVAEPSYLSEFNVTRRNSEEKALFDQYRQDYGSKAPDKKALLTVQLTGPVNHAMHNHAATTATAPATPVNESMPHSHSATSASMPSMAGMPMMGGAGVDAIQWDDPTNSDKANNVQNVAWKILDQATGKANMDINDWVFKKGQLVKIRLTNDTMAMHVMQHPIHLHGQRFVVLSNNGVINQNMVWKDTTLVPPGEYIDILADMSNTGVWMAHCHIVEHLFAGMMLPFRVEEENGSAAGDDFRKTVPVTAAPAAPQPSSNTSMNGMDMSQMNHGNMNMGQMQIPASDPNAPKMLTNNYTDVPSDKSYNVSTDIRFAEVGKETLIALTFSDTQGNAMSLDELLPRALDITFVNSDNSIRFTTYPGNTIFPPVIVPVSGSNSPDTQGFDESKPHMHPTSFLSIPVAYAHGGVTDGHVLAGAGKVYTVPVRFPAKGSYRGFVSFTLAGEQTPRVASFDIESDVKTFNINNFGLTGIYFGKTSQWWLLLLISVLLIVPIVFGVRKYINAK